MRAGHVIVTLSLAVASVTIVATATAEPGGPGGPVQPHTDSHHSVDEVADALMAHDSDPGFGQVTVDYDAATVIVRWKGNPNDDVRAIGAEQHDGVKVLLKPAPFGLAEFHEMASSLMANEADDEERPTILGVSPAEDMSGIEVELDPESLPSEMSLSQIENAYEEQVGVPVTVEMAQAPVTNLTRQNDSAPWQGGGAVADAHGTDYCSLGFAVLRGGVGYLASAQHCFANGVGQVVRDGSGQRIGSVSNRDRDGDTALVDPDATPATIGKVFGGPWNAGTGHARYQFKVAGSSNPANNAQLCTSGAVSGEHCNVTVQAAGKLFLCGLNGDGVCIGFEAWAPSGHVAVARGDSGGPVYKNRSDGRVGARGIISNTTASPITCGSTSVTTTCYRFGNAVNIESVLGRWGASIETQ